MDKPMRGAQGAINAAAKPHLMPRTKAKINTGSVGKETPSGGATNPSPGKGTRGSLATAVGHLHEEHPIKHDDRGPHHGRAGSNHTGRAISPNKGHPYG